MVASRKMLPQFSQLAAVHDIRSSSLPTAALEAACCGRRSHKQFATERYYRRSLLPTSIVDATCFRTKHRKQLAADRDCLGSVLLSRPLARDLDVCGSLQTPGTIVEEALAE